MQLKVQLPFNKFNREEVGKAIQVMAFDCRLVEFYSPQEALLEIDDNYRESLSASDKVRFNEWVLDGSVLWVSWGDWSYDKAADQSKDFQWNFGIEATLDVDNTAIVQKVYDDYMNICHNLPDAGIYIGHEGEMVIPVNAVTGGFFGGVAKSTQQGNIEPKLLVGMTKEDLDDLTVHDDLRAYKAKCERQEAQIAKLHDRVCELVNELDVEMKKSKKWEYHTVSWNYEEWEERFSELGSAGWELVSVINAGDTWNPVAYFKRGIKE